MMKTSSKFSVSTRQSIIAFIVMIFLILVASGISGNIKLSQASTGNSYDFVLEAPQAPDPSPTPFQPFIAKSSTHSSTHAFTYIPMVYRDVPPTAEAILPTDVAEVVAEEVVPEEVVAEEQPLPTEVVIEVEITPQEALQVAQPTSPAVQIETTPDPFVAQDVELTSDEGKAWEDYAGPTVWPDIEVPAPAGVFSHPEDQVNILLLGSDQREYDVGFRTDTIQLLTINPSQGTVKLTSFPRDLYVYIPGYTVQRINTAFGWGGFEALADTMEYNFGVRPEYFVLINFWSFVDVIDSMGGITVDIGRDLCDHRDDFGEYCVSQGTMWMAGDTALWYVRSRYTTSDLDRGRRQQEVLKAAFNTLISLNGIKRAPELYEIYKANVTTNLTFDVMARFIPLAAHLANTQDIDNYSIGAEQVYDWTNYSGAMVLVPIRESVLDVMRQVISGP
jgi:LCP family protein required for cell wall assembly